MANICFFLLILALVLVKIKILKSFTKPIDNEPDSVVE